MFLPARDIERSRDSLESRHSRECGEETLAQETLCQAVQAVVSFQTSPTQTWWFHQSREQTDCGEPDDAQHDARAGHEVESRWTQAFHVPQRNWTTFCFQKTTKSPRRAFRHHARGDAPVRGAVSRQRLLAPARRCPFRARFSRPRHVWIDSRRYERSFDEQKNAKEMLPATTSPSRFSPGPPFPGAFLHAVLADQAG